ncbi:VTC domain-containing protein [Microbacterium awajiense]|uniref:VTC domain-containing protein n=1 Tax=Microbacterium awajiense TaxID=415214 RepID=A0ABP7ADC9_9MICO
MNTIATLAPVTLDELVAEAALLARVDRKYVLPRDAVAPWIARLDPATRVLEIDGARTFAYESVYFDTPDLLSFHLAAQPRRRRFKLRTRAYLDSGDAFLEIKTRGARGLTVKEREEYDPAHLDELTDDAYDRVADALDGIGVAPHVVDELQPMLRTRYRRLTLLSADGVGRVTIDTDLTWISPDGAGFALPDVAIVETKSGSVAGDADRALWRDGHRPETVSKYATGLAALHPALPRNRWARLLRGPFSPHHRTSPTPRTKETPCFAAA